MLADQLNVDAPVTAKQAAEERRGSRFVRSCFSLAELERQLMSSQPEEESVPPTFVQAAVSMPWIRNLNTTRDGPATRRDQLGPAPEESQSDAPSSEDAANSPPNT